MLKIENKIQVLGTYILLKYHCVLCIHIFLNNIFGYILVVIENINILIILNLLNRRNIKIPSLKTNLPENFEIQHDLLESENIK